MVVKAEEYRTISRKVLYFALLLISGSIGGSITQGLQTPARDEIVIEQQIKDLRRDIEELKSIIRKQEERLYNLERSHYAQTPQGN